MSAAWYPKASRVQIRSYGTIMPGINKLLLHTTESSDWPSYPSFAPTLTYHPWRHAWRQHMPIRGSASTLANAPGLSTNRDNVVQIEIIGFADESMGARYNRFIGDIDQGAVNDLAEFAAWLRDHYGLQIRNDVQWKAYNNGRVPSSYGSNNGVRLSVGQYRACRGLLGHMHAPGNDHGDPGSLDVNAIMRAAGGASAPTTTPEDEDMPITRFHCQRGATQTLATADEWQTLKVSKDDPESNEFDVVKGPTNVIAGIVRLEISGLDLENSVWVRGYAVDTYSGDNKKQAVGTELKFDGSHDGWVKIAFPFDWLLGGGPDDAKGRFLRFEWKSDTGNAKIERTEISGAEVRED